MKKKAINGILIVTVIAISLAATVFLVRSKPAPAKDNKIENVLYVKAENPVYNDQETEFVYRGRVSAYDNISLSAEVSGKIMQGDVRLKTGERFNKGNVIIKIYDEDIKASLRSGKSSFLQTVSRILPDMKVDFANEYQKWLNFFNAIDPDKALPALPKINSDKERVFLASNNVLSSYYNLQQQEIILERYVIKAPFTGIFKSVNKEPGAIASPGAELANIIRSDKLEIIVPVFPDDLKWIKKGEKVSITGIYGETYQATVSRISGFVDQSTQSVNVYLTYNPKGKDSFLEGEYVDVVFNGVKVSGFEIPREALVDDHYVYELKDNMLEKTKVDVVRMSDDKVIIAGLDTSKVIVTESLTTPSQSVKYIAR